MTLHTNVHDRIVRDVRYGFYHYRYPKLPD